MTLHHLHCINLLSVIALTLKWHNNHRTSKCEQFVFYYSPTCTATASGPTGVGGQSTFVDTGIPTIIGALVTATGTITAALIARRCVCCPNKCKCKYAFNTICV